MTDRRIPLWLIFGGRSAEHEVSLSSGRTAAAKLDHSRFAVTPVYIRRDGSWVPGQVLNKAEETQTAFENLLSARNAINAGEAVALARAEGIAAALLILHGSFGEDGTIQGMLEMAGLPYTGSGVLASALAMDKVRCQQFLGAAGIPVSPFIYDADATRGADQLARRADEKIGFPCVVKPSRAGSSVGVSIVKHREQLLHAIRNAASVDPLVMVEQYVSGEEVTCGVIEEWSDGRVEQRALPVTMIRPKNSEFFDFKAKYTAGESEEITPAPISDELTERVQQYALKTFEAIGCRDLARVDFILGEHGPVLLEINTIPGMTPTSLIPQQAASVGIEFAQLLEMFVNNSLSRSEPE